MWGIIPAAGQGTRIQPLAFSKELLPIGRAVQGHAERPKAVSEHLVERMMLAGAERLCMVVSPGKHDLLRYWGQDPRADAFCFVVQPRPLGLCDAIFRALPCIAEGQEVLVGLPDTIWFPVDGFSLLPGGGLSFLLFEVDRPERFDAVVTDAAGRVQEIQVKAPVCSTRWIWGAFRLTGAVLGELYALWRTRGCSDVYLGTLVNAYLARGGTALGVPLGRRYVDVGTVDGYYDAVRLLSGEVDPSPEPRSSSRRAPGVRR